jgi:hypothetical protein
VGRNALRDAERMRWHGDDGRIHEITYQGRYLKWRYLERQVPPETGKTRGEVCEFSRKSRMRMLSLFNRVDWPRAGKCLFITLTYPDDCYPADNKVMSKHLHLFRRKMEKHLEKQVPLVWRIEWEERESGSKKNYVYPHFHLMIIGVPYIHYAKVNSWWRGILGFPDKLRTETKGCKNRIKSFVYITQYCAKRNGSLVFGPYLNNPWNGRRWGKLRYELLPFADEHYLRTFDYEHLQDAYYHALEGRAELNEYGNKSFTLLGDQAEDVGNFIFGLTIDGEIIDV